MRALLAAVVLVIAAAGCAAAPLPVPSPRQSLAPIPPDGRPLAAFGINNGPPGFSLPASTRGVIDIDDPKVVTLIISAPEASLVSDYLRANLPGQGYRISGEAPGSLVFEGPGYRGALTSSGDVTALTLRRTG
ncbi:MAG: hypothetical protein Q3997_01870 [Propionibacteriaceae bacterium]|nr:hypothetical protein [Propionibacteriaceae bacterium]